MSQSLSDLKTTLNIRIGDTDNFTFTDEEKTQALTEAFNDDYVLREVWDTSLTFDVSTYQYAKPDGVDVVVDIYIRSSNSTDTEPAKIDSKLWEVVGANIQFKNNAEQIVPDGYTLYIKGKTKYVASDSIAETNLQEYILNLSISNLYATFMHKKAFKFVKNDTSVSEIVATKREAERRVAEYRRRMPKAFQSA
jgi:hypothetical protein